ncbi:MAG: hypothetical protein ACYTEQ_22145 [Planctomycetota bacterium]|jgi:hypothetical protein
MKEIILILLGGICSALGGCIAIWYQSKKARQIRMEELKGEQQLEACKKALSLIDQIQSLLIQGTSDDVLKILYDNGAWFSMNQVLLPHTFVENWRSVRLNLRSVKRQDDAQQRMTDGAERDKMINKIADNEEFIQQLADEAEAVLREELGLKEVKIKKRMNENG